MKQALIVKHSLADGVTLSGSLEIAGIIYSGNSDDDQPGVNTMPATINLLADEAAAVLLFENKGVSQIRHDLERLSAIADERMAECFRINRSIPYGYTAINFLTEEERGDLHLIKLALVLFIDERKEAHDRIIARRAAMRKRREF